MIDFKKGSVVSIEVWAYLGIDARRTLADCTSLRIASLHAIHIGRRTTQVRQIALEVGHLYHLLHLLHNAFLRTTCDELALMGANGTESTTSETATMNINRELDHLISRNTLTLIFRVWKACVRHIKRTVEFFCSHRRIRRIHNSVLPVHTLQQTLRMHLVRLFLDMAEVISLSLTVYETFFMAIKNNVVITYSSRHFVLTTKVYCLRNIMDVADVLSFTKICT